MIVEEKIEINAPPETVFALYADVKNWNSWDPDTKSSSLDGEFCEGTTGRLNPTQGHEVSMVVTSVIPNRSFTVESKIPGCVMHFDHELTPITYGVEALHRITFSGPLAFLFGRIVGGRARKGLPHTMAKLKSVAEANYRKS